MSKIRQAQMATAAYKTTVTMTFTPLDDGTRTMVEIKEEGWRENQGALEASSGNCQGWSQMLCAMKAWIEHGINLPRACTNRGPFTERRPAGTPAKLPR